MCNIIVELSIRNYYEDDYPEILELWHSAGLKTSLSDRKEEISKLAFKEDNQFFLLLINNRIVGSIICAHDGRRGYIHHLAIHPKYQKYGYGKLLMQKAKDHYESLQTVKVHIFIEDTNQQVIEFYKKIGWVIRDDIILMTQTLRSE